jgi:hypothetical protein
MNGLMDRQILLCPGGNTKMMQVFLKTFIYFAQLQKVTQVVTF